MQERLSGPRQLGVDPIAGNRTEILAEDNLVGHLDVVRRELGCDVPHRCLPHHSVLAVVAAARTEVRAVAPPPAADDMQEVIERADAGKLERALKLLEPACAAGVQS